MLARPATEPELSAVHTQQHIRRVAATSSAASSSLSKEDWQALGITDGYYNQHTSEAALLAAGGTVEACMRVALGQVPAAVAFVRPPGHHAEADKTSGFCVYCNAAVAAEAVLRNTDVEQVIVCDKDIHVGNGPLSIFYNRDDVLAWSCHRYDR